MEREEKYNIKLSYYGEQIEITINSDYNAFICNLCNVLKISPERTNTIILSYNDEDGDNILLSNEEDYSIFIEQVKQKVVQELIIELNDNLEDSALNNKNGIEQSNINNNESFNNIVNSSMNNIHNFDEKNKNIPIENFVYYYKCTSCSTYPIILIMYYCDKCNKYLCEKCYNKEKNHCHKMEKIITKFQLDEIKRIENENIERNKNEQIRNCKCGKNYNINNNYNNLNNFCGYKNGYNIYNNHNNQNRNHICSCGNNNQNSNYIFPNSNSKQNYNYSKTNFKNYDYGKVNSHNNNFIKTHNIFESQEKRYLRMLPDLKRKYDLKGISDKQLIEALKIAKGDINKTLTYLSNNNLFNQT